MKAFCEQEGFCVADRSPQRILLKNEKPFPAEVVEGLDVFRLIDVIGQHIKQVDDNGPVRKIYLDHDVTWKTGLKSLSKALEAETDLIARGAAFIAAEGFLQGGFYSESTGAKMTKLSGHAAVLAKHPWANDPEHLLSYEIKVSHAINSDPDKLLEAVKGSRARRYIPASAGAMGAAILACDLATPPPPAIVYEIPPQLSSSSSVNVVYETNYFLPTAVPTKEETNWCDQAHPWTHHWRIRQGEAMVLPPTVNSPETIIFGETPLEGDGPFYFEDIAHFSYTRNSCGEGPEGVTQQLSEPNTLGWVIAFQTVRGTISGDVSGYYYVTINDPNSDWDGMRLYYRIK